MDVETYTHFQSWRQAKDRKQERDTIHASSAESVNKRVENIQKFLQSIWNDVKKEYKQMFAYDDVMFSKIKNAIETHLNNKIKLIGNKQVIYVDGINLVDENNYSAFFQSGLYNFKQIIKKVVDELKQIAVSEINNTTTSNDNVVPFTNQMSTFIVEYVGSK